MHKCDLYPLFTCAPLTLCVQIHFIFGDSSTSGNSSCNIKRNMLTIDEGISLDCTEKTRKAAALHKLHFLMPRMQCTIYILHHQSFGTVVQAFSPFPYHIYWHYTISVNLILSQIGCMRLQMTDKSKCNI